MAEFLFEIGLEEVPARMIAGAQAELEQRVVEMLERERLVAVGCGEQELCYAAAACGLGEGCCGAAGGCGGGVGGAFGEDRVTRMEWLRRRRWRLRRRLGWRSRS